MGECKVSLEVVGGPCKGRRFEFAQKDTFTVGRASDCTLCVKEDGELSRHHLHLSIDQSTVHIRDMGSLNGTRVNGRAIYCGRIKGNTPAPMPEELRNGDRIEIGGIAMVIHITGHDDERGWVG